MKIGAALTAPKVQQVIDAANQTRPAGRQHGGLAQKRDPPRARPARADGPAYNGLGLRGRVLHARQLVVCCRHTCSVRAARPGSFYQRWTPRWVSRAARRHLDCSPSRFHGRVSYYNRTIPTASSAASTRLCSEQIITEIHWPSDCAETYSPPWSSCHGVHHVRLSHGGAEREMCRRHCQPKDHRSADQDSPAGEPRARSRRELAIAKTQPHTGRKSKTSLTDDSTPLLPNMHDSHTAHEPHCSFESLESSSTKRCCSASDRPFGLRPDLNEEFTNDNTTDMTQGQLQLIQQQNFAGLQAQNAALQQQLAKLTELVNCTCC